MKVAGKFADCAVGPARGFRLHRFGIGNHLLRARLLRRLPRQRLERGPSGAGAGEKLENAMSQNGSDGSPDTVYVDSGTYVDTDSLKAGGSDGLTVIGNGRDRSFITSSVAGNYYVVDLNFGNSRHITMKDLAIVIPEDFLTTTGPARRSSPRVTTSIQLT